jgi:release factor glutamine methyltransferase
VDRSAVIDRLRAAGCVFAEDEARLLISAADTAAELEALVARRAAGVPLEHVVGSAEFCGLQIAVDPGVFVPRRRSEFLVRWAAANARAGVDRPPVIVDLCCGSGALGVALNSLLGGGQLYAADLDPAAVRCAARNVVTVAGRVYQGDLYEPLPDALRGRVDILIANAPYVPTAEIRLLPSEARVHEAPMALDGGGDGLDVLRRVIADAPSWLASGGVLLIETSERQAPIAVDVVAAGGLQPEVARSEEWDATVVIGRWV